jgi:hypothetical protein
MEFKVISTVFETEANGKKYRHLYYVNLTEATVENLMELIDELSSQLQEYNKEDFCRIQLSTSLEGEFDSDKTLVNLAYRISKQIVK